MGYLWDKSDEQIRRDAARAKAESKSPVRKKRAMERVHDASRPDKTTVRPVSRGGRVHDASKKRGGRFRTGQHND